MPRTSPTAVEAFVESVEKEKIDLTSYRGLVGLYKIAEQWREQAMRMWTGKRAPTPFDAAERCQEFVIDPAVGNVLNERVTRSLESWVRASLEELERRRSDIRETVRLVRSMLRRLEWRLSYYRRQLRRAREQYERTRSWYYEVESRYYERIIRELEEQERNIRSILREYEHALRNIDELLRHRDEILRIVREYEGVYDMINGEVLERASQYARDVASARESVIRAVTDIVNRGYVTWNELYTLAWIGYYLGRVEWYYDILRVAALHTRPEIVNQLKPLEEVETSLEQIAETSPLALVPEHVTRQGSEVVVRYRSSIGGLSKTLKLKVGPVRLFTVRTIVDFSKRVDRESRKVAYRKKIVEHGLTVHDWYKVGGLLLSDVLPSLVQLYIVKKREREDIVKKIAEVLALDLDFTKRLMETVYGSLGIPMEVVYIKLKSGRVDTLIKIGMRNAPQLYIYSKYRKSVMKSETWESCSDEEVTLSRMPLPSLGVTLWFPAGDYIVHDTYSESKLGRVWFTWAIDSDGRKRIIDELKRQSILIVKTPGGYFYFLDILSKNPNKVMKIAHRLEKMYGDVGHKRAAYVRQRAGSQAWGVVRIWGKYGSRHDVGLEVVYERPSQYSDLEEWKCRVLRLITGEEKITLPELHVREMCLKLGDMFTPEILSIFKVSNMCTIRYVKYVEEMLSKLDDESLVKLFKYLNCTRSST